MDPISGRVFGGRCPKRARRGHGSWYFSIDLPAFWGSVGRRRVRRGGFVTRRADGGGVGSVADAGGCPDGNVLTVSGWLEHWLVTRSAQRESTLRGYRSHVGLYLTPYLGRIVLAELTVGQVQAMLH